MATKARDKSYGNEKPNTNHMAMKAQTQKHMATRPKTKHVAAKNSQL